MATSAPSLEEPKSVVHTAPRIRDRVRTSLKKLDWVGIENDFLDHDASTTGGDAPTKETKASEYRLKKNKNEYEAYTQQFSTTIIISTFTAALIVAFLSFARDVLLDNGEKISSNRHLHIGSLLGFLAMATHLLIIIIAGRAATLCHRIHTLGRRPANLILDDFHMFFYLCEQLHLVATGLFLITLLFLSFGIFTPLISHYVVLYAFTSISLYLIYRTGFWKASVLGDDLILIKELLIKGFRIEAIWNAINNSNKKEKKEGSLTDPASSSAQNDQAESVEHHELPGETSTSSAQPTCITSQPGQATPSSVNTTVGAKKTNKKKIRKSTTRKSTAVTLVPGRDSRLVSTEVEEKIQDESALSEVSAYSGSSTSLARSILEGAIRSCRGGPAVENTTGGENIV